MAHEYEHSFFSFCWKEKPNDNNKNDFGKVPVSCPISTSTTLPYFCDKFYLPCSFEDPYQWVFQWTLDLYWRFRYAEEGKDHSEGMKAWTFLQGFWVFWLLMSLIHRTMHGKNYSYTKVSPFYKNKIEIKITRCFCIFLLNIHTQRPAEDIASVKSHTAKWA